VRRHEAGDPVGDGQNLGLAREDLLGEHPVHPRVAVEAGVGSSERRATSLESFSSIWV
jgi:hypothetical protein